MTVTASKYETKANWLYETEAWATRALLRHVPVRGVTVWEPAAGNHKMARVMNEAGAAVLTSDIARYDADHDEIFDFINGSFEGLWLVGMHDAIITNPPYGDGNRLAVKFCEKALQVCDGPVAMLLTAKFDSGKTRRHLFADNPRFAAKIVLTDRISWEGNGKTGTEDHAWYVWDRAPLVRRAPVLIYEGKAE